MKVSRRFTAGDTMVDLVTEDYNILPVLSRFSLPLGVGSLTIGELCESQGISTDVFLLIVNFLLSGNIDSRMLLNAPVTGVVDFLHNSHNYFLNYKFPHIRANLLEALDDDHPDVNPIIVNFFDDLVRHVNDHFRYEETTVWPYVRALAEGKKTDYRISTFSRQHDDEISRTLNELKNIILRYYNTSKPDKMYDVLVDIFNVEEDLESHNVIENEILVPLVAAAEKRQGR
ncbi:MAG: hemerythrin domain-containing protein [Bacteroides sp.]|nr:hemerythrin domain-containing protein [Bacteroides sp.]